MKGEKMSKLIPLLILVLAQCLQTAFAQEPSPEQLGHGKSITSLVFSPDGKRLASAAGDSTIKLWDIARGELSLSIRAHELDIIDVDFAPDGKSLASVGANDRTLKVWEVMTGKLLHSARIDSHGTLGALKFSPDGRMLAFGNSEGVVRVWSTREWKEALSLFDPKTADACLKNTFSCDVQDLEFSPDSKTLAVADQISIKLWDVAAKRLVWALQTTNLKFTSLTTGETGTEPSKWNHVAFSPDGRSIACGSESELRLVDANSGETRKAVGLWLDSFAFSPDGGFLVVTALASEQLFYLDAQTWKLTEKFNEKEYISGPLAFSPDGRLLAGRVGLEVLNIWNVGEKKVALSFGTNAKANAVAWSPGVLGVADADGDVLLFDPQTGRRVGLCKGQGDAITGLAFSPDGQLLVGTRWSGSSLMGLQRAKSGPPPHSLSGEEKLLIWDAKTGRLLHALENDKPTYAPVFSPDGSYLATPGLDGSIRIWQPRTGRLIRRLPASRGGEVKVVAFSADGRQLGAVVDDGKILAKVWTTGAWTLLRSSPLPVEYSWEIRHSNSALSPDLNFFASSYNRANSDALKIWNIAAGRIEHDLGESSPVMAIRFSADGRLLASALYTEEIKVWDTRSRKLLATLSGHISNITSLAFSPTGEQLLSGSEDGTARIWNVRTGALLKTILAASN